jgi:formamidopyrimidine-DNA glycosylase
MPELAEVEFYRRKWSAGLGAAVTRVRLHATKRLFRGTNTGELLRSVTGAKLSGSAAHGKQMRFDFSGRATLGIHLGMTGELLVEEPEFIPRRHDHLVLFQRERALVFSDPRMFGRVLFSANAQPEWWRDLPPEILSANFTAELVRQRFARCRTLPLKAALLEQETFPGIGNWMADEILWQCRLHPRARAGSLTTGQVRQLWRTTRSVTRRAIETVAADVTRSEFGDPPAGFLFHVRWRKGMSCPRDGESLRHETVGGRTTAWCPKCQPMTH